MQLISVSWCMYDGHNVDFSFHRNEPFENEDWRMKTAEDIFDLKYFSTMFALIHNRLSVFC